MQGQFTFRDTRWFEMGQLRRLPARTRVADLRNPPRLPYFPIIPLN